MLKSPSDVQLVSKTTKRMSELQRLETKDEVEDSGTVQAALTVLKVHVSFISQAKLIHSKMCHNSQAIQTEKRVFVSVAMFQIFCCLFLLQNFTPFLFTFLPLIPVAAAALSERHAFLCCSLGTIFADIIHSLLMSIT